jgi:hypothetical protein
MQRRYRIIFIAVGLGVSGLQILSSVVLLRRGHTPQYGSPPSIASLEQVAGKWEDL